MLYYNQSLGGWYCRDVGSGSVGGQDLLSVLQEGSDASTFAGPTSIGGNVTVGGDVIADDGDFVLRNGGAHRWRISYPAGGGLKFKQVYDAGGTLQNTDRLFISDSGDVGIGTNSPGYGLQVDNGHAFVKGPDGFNTSGEEAALYLGSAPEHYIKAVYGGGLRIGTYQAVDALNIQQTTGNVGINSTSPNAKLYVYNEDAQFTGLFISDTDTSIKINTSNTASNSNLWFTNSGDNDNSWVIGRQDDGKFRIGVSTSTWPNYNTDPDKLLTVDHNGNVGGRADFWNSDPSKNYSFRSGVDGAVANYTASGTLTLNYIDAIEVKADRVKTAKITHEETIAGNQTFYGSYTCESCNLVRKDCQDNRGVWERLADYFSISKANARAIQYSSCTTYDAPECGQVGTAAENCSNQVSQVNDTLSYEDCDGGTQNINYISSRTCNGCTAGTGDVTKMDFYYDSGTSRNTVEVHGDLKADENVHGDCISAAWNATQKTLTCDNGYYLTQINLDGDGICCKL